MKKTSFFLLVLSLVVILGACNKDNDNTKSEIREPTKEEVEEIEKGLGELTSNEKVISEKVIETLSIGEAGLVETDHVKYELTPEKVELLVDDPNGRTSNNGQLIAITVKVKNIGEGSINPVDVIMGFGKLLAASDTNFEGELKYQEGIQVDRIEPGATTSFTGIYDTVVDEDYLYIAGSDTFGAGNAYWEFNVKKDEAANVETVGDILGEKEGFDLFIEADSSVTFQYPEDWEYPYVSYDDEYEAYYHLDAPEKPREKMSPSFTIEESKNEYESVSAFAAADFEDYVHLPKLKIFKEENIQIDGKDAIYKKYKWRTDKPGFGWIDIHQIKVYVLNGEYAYEITFEAYDEIMDKYADLGNEIIETIKFKEPGLH